MKFHSRPPSLQPLLFLLVAFSAVALLSHVSAEEMKDCFACKGKGTETCRACTSGKKNCPAPCLKLNAGKWEHMEVAGHGPDELWQKFSYVKDGKRFTQAWTQAHVGEVIEIRNGEPVNTGRCKTCGGATTVACDKCRGSATIPCAMCDGKKQVPASWTATNNPKIDADPSYIRFKDGSVVKGRIAMQLGDTVTIKADDGRILNVTKDQIVPRAVTNSIPGKP